PPPGSAEIEEDLFWTPVVGPLDKAPGSSGVPERRATEALPFRVSGGEPRLREVYPVMAQPVAPGSLSGWVGRYATPQAKLRFEMSSPLFKDGLASLEADLPEKALEARDLPRRWARARVDHLLRPLQAGGRRPDWAGAWM